MIDLIRGDIRQRVDDGVSHFATICSTRDRKSIVRGKGLAFVEMYAVHEFAVMSAVKMGIAAVSNHGIQVHALRPGLLALAADDRLKGVQDSPTKSQWTARESLFSWISSATTADMNLQVFPLDGSHFRLQQLETVWKLFSLKGRPVPDRRLLQLVDEVVANRNAIAHGRERPEEIGCRYASDEIKKKFRQLGRIALHLVNKLGEHCTDARRLCR